MSHNKGFLNISPALFVALRHRNLMSLGDIFYLAVQPMFIYFYTPQFGDFSRKLFISRRFIIAIALIFISSIFLFCSVLLFFIDLFDFRQQFLTVNFLLFFISMFLTILQLIIFPFERAKRFDDNEIAISRLLLVKKFKSDRNVSDIHILQYSIIEDSSLVSFKDNQRNNIDDLLVENDKLFVEEAWKRSGLLQKFEMDH